MDGIDLILGGHDHHYTHSVESDVTILKSGSEFREFSTIDVKYYGPHSVSSLFSGLSSVASEKVAERQVYPFIGGSMMKPRRTKL